jgi:hypothetical protein
VLALVGAGVLGSLTKPSEGGVVGVLTTTSCWHALSKRARAVKGISERRMIRGGRKASIRISYAYANRPQ